MSDKNDFLRELSRQQAAGGDPTAQLVGDELGWAFDRISVVLEGLVVSGLVSEAPAQRRMGDTHLDDWVTLTTDGRGWVKALEKDGDDGADGGPADGSGSDVAAHQANSLVERWNRIDLPVLRELARAAESDEGRLLMDEVTARLGVRYRDVHRSVDVLKETGHVQVTYTHDDGGELSFIRLSKEALEKTGLWPTPELALDRMIAALDAIAQNTNDEDTRTRAQRFASWLRTSGTTVGLSVASSVVTGQLPGGQ